MRYIQGLSRLIAVKIGTPDIKYKTYQSIQNAN
jgi:hypothetical protein